MCTVEHKNIVDRYSAELQKIIDKQNERIGILREYIREFGYCGMDGAAWTESKRKCFECSDKDVCERYRLLTKWG